MSELCQGPKACPWLLRKANIAEDDRRNMERFAEHLKVKVGQRLAHS
ncbi:MAG: hypothetical protein QXH39_04250 [Conexivisphaerales archaeon]